jgi:hypothetical protein
VRDEFDLSASNNSIPPSTPILFPVLCENETNLEVTAEVEGCEK